VIAVYRRFTWNSSQKGAIEPYKSVTSTFMESRFIRNNHSIIAKKTRKTYIFVKWFGKH